MVNELKHVQDRNGVYSVIFCFDIKYHTVPFWSIYNIPRAYLLNRSPVPAMDLKSNRSGL